MNEEISMISKTENEFETINRPMVQNNSEFLADINSQKIQSANLEQVGDSELLFIAPDGTFWNSKDEYYSALEQMSCYNPSDAQWQAVDEELEEGLKRLK